MLKQNKNRGAGLVTVVVVLAVCSILLAGVVAVSFNHYKNAIRQTQSREELAEIELFAEIVNAALLEDNITADTVFANPSLLFAFYEVSEDQSMVFEMVSVASRTDENGKQVYIVSCGNSSREYQFKDEAFKPYEPPEQEESK